MKGANLQGADLSFATIEGANFSNVNLRDANLTGSKIDGCYLVRTDFRGAIVQWTTFDTVDFREPTGLDLVRHLDSSTIGVNAIHMSNGGIPEQFLRGAGVPDSMIAYARSLIGSRVDYCSCFISYSTKDQEFATRLHTDLQNKGVRCWFAPHDIRAGKKLHEQIERAIRINDRLLLVLSNHSMNSEWVKTELAHARQKELSEGRQVLFPIAMVPFARIREWKCFDADTGKDSAREIREYFIPDFSNWKDYGTYQRTFERLVMDLKV